MSERKKMTADELRGYLESMPSPFCTESISDEEIESISNSLEIEMREILQWEKDGSITHDKAEEYETEIIESLCLDHNIPYYDDL